jgi:hypothetical protein
VVPGSNETDTSTVDDVSVGDDDMSPRECRHGRRSLRPT